MIQASKVVLLIADKCVICEGEGRYNAVDHFADENQNHWYIHRYLGDFNFCSLKVAEGKFSVGILVLENSISPEPIFFNQFFLKSIT